MPMLASEALLRENKKIQWQNLTTSEYWIQASNEPLIPSSTLSFLHYLGICYLGDL